MFKIRGENVSRQRSVTNDQPSEILLLKTKWMPPNERVDDIECVESEGERNCDWTYNAGNISNMTKVY